MVSRVLARSARMYWGRASRATIRLQSKPAVEVDGGPHGPSPLGALPNASADRLAASPDATVEWLTIES